MTSPLIVVPKYQSLGKGYKARDRMREDPGRQTNPKKGYQSPAAYLDDLAALKRAIILCSFCVNKWGSPRKKGYRARFVPDPSGTTSGYAVQGKCDACKQMTGHMGGGKVYVAADLWKRVSMDPVEAKRRARNLWSKRRDMSNLKKVIADATHNPHKYRPKRVSFTMSDKRRVK